jgi:hypothetical protein
LVIIRTSVGIRARKNDGNRKKLRRARRMKA